MAPDGDERSLRRALLDFLRSLEAWEGQGCEKPPG